MANKGQFVKSFGQWDVYNNYIQSGSGAYDISANQLRTDEQVNEWKERMRVKQWVNMDSFIDAVNYLRRLNEF